MAKTNPFEYVNSIKSTKKTNLIETALDKVAAERGYDCFITNRHFSFFPELITFVNELNKYNQIDKKLQYEFFLHLVRPTNKSPKWEKKLKVDDLDVVRRYFNFSYTKSLAALSILSEDQIAAIRAKLDQGGVR